MNDKSRLAGVLESLGAGLVFAEDAAAFAESLELARSMGIPAVAAGTGVAGVTSLEAFVAEYKDDAFAGVDVGPDTIAKILFTSGSTGGPKGVMVTHRMITSNQQAIAQVWPFLSEAPPTLVDWLPWNHVYGGNLVFNCALFDGGQLVIDDGKPVPALFAETLRNLEQNPPTVHLGVPRGFGLLVEALENDARLAETYFSRLRAMFTAGAALPADIWQRFRGLASRHGHSDLQIHVAWGATETAPVATITPPDNGLHNNIGAPIPGASIKLAPNDGKLEAACSRPARLSSSGFIQIPRIST